MWNETSWQTNLRNGSELEDHQGGHTESKNPPGRVYQAKSYALESCVDLVKVQILIQQVQGGAQGSAFLTSSQGIPCHWP